MDLLGKNIPRRRKSQCKILKAWWAWQVEKRMMRPTPVLIAALCMVPKRWEEPKYPSVDERISKMWSSRTMEYYSVIKRDEFLTYAITWMVVCLVK